jgi:ribosome-associated translation inhibitor RaiA
MTERVREWADKEPGYMLVQINTDRNIEGTEALAQQAEEMIRGALDRFSGHLTRVEVHLSDVNSDQRVGPGDKRCLLEARLTSRQPIAVSHQASTVEQAMDGAAQKMTRSLEKILGRMSER